MDYLSVVEISKKWGISARSVRNYCQAGRVPGAFLTGKTWNIPADAQKPARLPKASTEEENLLSILRREKKSKLPGDIYHKIQVDLTYNSNHIEGSQLTHDQTRFIFETNTIGMTQESINVDDIVETSNHFRCIDMIIDAATYKLTETMIKQLHNALKQGTSDSRKDWFVVGDYKKLPNEVGGQETTPPSQVHNEIKRLLNEYNSIESVTLDDILNFHVRFESIHPFQDGNGRIGRLIMFKECLKHNIVPFIISDQLKLYYYRGLQEWRREKGYLRDTCMTAQDLFSEIMDYFQIPYSEWK